MFAIVLEWWALRSFTQLCTPLPENVAESNFSMFEASNSQGAIEKQGNAKLRAATFKSDTTPG